MCVTKLSYEGFDQIELASLSPPLILMGFDAKTEANIRQHLHRAGIEVTSATLEHLSWPVGWSRAGTIVASTAYCTTLKAICTKMDEPWWYYDSTLIILKDRQEQMIDNYYDLAFSRTFILDWPCATQNLVQTLSLLRDRSALSEVFRWDERGLDRNDNAITDHEVVHSGEMAVKQQLFNLAVKGRALAERRLLATEQRFDTIMKLIGHVPFVADQTGSLTYVGSEWEQRTGGVPMAAHFQSWILLVHRDDLEGTLAQWRAAIADGARIKIDFRLRDSVGGYRWCRAKAGPLRDPADGALTWYGTFQDVDRTYKAKIEHEKTQSALIHFSRLTAMGAMASTLAHELNQPLTAITGFVRASRLLLEAEGNVREVHEALTSADKAATRAGEIVRRVRELVVSGQVEKRPEKISTIINEAAEVFLIDARLVDVLVKIDVEENLPDVMVGRIQIQQVILNIVRNAIEAVLAERDRLIQIDVARADSAHCAITVTDTGPGIAPEIAPRLFEMFNTSKTAGSGIGLSICRTIVEAHGGKIWYNTQSGGAQIVFTVPFVD